MWLERESERDREGGGRGGAAGRDLEDARREALV